MTTNPTPYTPSDEDILEDYAAGRTRFSPGVTFTVAREEFRAWLDARDARVRAEAVRAEYMRHLKLMSAHRIAGRLLAGEAEAKIATAYKEDADRLARAAAIEQEVRS